MIDITTDYHIHTKFCHHASGEMEDYVKAALEKGLNRIIFTEHFEAAIDYYEPTWLTPEEFDLYREIGANLKGKYKNRIEVGIGVEVGFNPDSIKETIQFLQKYSWDRVGISYHYLKTTGKHANMVSKRSRNIDPLLEIGTTKVATTYFKGLLHALDVLPGTALCHIDAVLRHAPVMEFTKEHHHYIYTILKVLKDKKMALEVNTSGYPLRGEPYPERSIIKEALSLGVRLEAGSDAHRPQDVGRYFERLPGLVSELSFY